MASSQVGVLDGDAEFPLRTEFIEAGGERYEVLAWGDPASDKLALCLHGFPEHAVSWRFQGPLLARLGYKVWAPNQRGYGASFQPSGIEPYAIDHLVGDVGRFIDAAGCQSVTLIGHDWGGAVAWAAAILQVRPLDCLIVMNLPHPACMAEGLRTWRQRLRSWYALFVQVPRLAEWLLGARDAALVALAFEQAAFDPARFPKDILRVYRDNALRPGGLTAMVNWYRAAFRFRDRMAKVVEAPELLDTPTLLVWGEEDRALGVELTYGTDRFVRNLTIRYLPGISHWVQQEAPDAVNAMLEAWLTDEPVPVARRVLVLEPPARDA